MKSEHRDTAADLLWIAEVTRTPIRPLHELYPDITVEDAYRIQLRNIERQISGGATIVGHKVGLLSKVMQEMLGVDEPDYGHLLNSMDYTDSGSIDIADFCSPRIEVELAYVLLAPLSGEECTEEDVLSATAYVQPSIELIDSRIIDWDIAITDTIADNASSAGFILGPERRRADEVDVSNIQATVFINDQKVTQGNTGAVLGNPTRSVAWLAEKVHPFGVKLLAGQVVLPGSCTAAIGVRSGDRVRAEFTGLGSVEAEFTISRGGS